MEPLFMKAPLQSPPVGFLLFGLFLAPLDAWNLHLSSGAVQSALSWVTDKDFFQFVQLKVQAYRERDGRIGCVECHSVIQMENVKHVRASSSGRTGRTGSDEIPCTDLRQNAMSHVGSCYLFSQYSLSERKRFLHPRASFIWFHLSLYITWAL